MAFRFSPRSAAAVLGLTFALAGAALPAAAWPKYAVKEKKPCGYCHTNVKGGGARNANGLWYAKHNHTFAGYSRAAAAKAAGVPLAKVPLAPSASPSPKPVAKASPAPPSRPAR